MRRLPDTAPRRRPRIVWAVVAGFIGAMALAAVMLVEHLHNETRRVATARLERAASGAEAVVNRTLLSVDLLLADLGREILDSPPGTPPAAIDDLLRRPARRTMWLREIALLDAQGRVLYASDPQVRALGLALPPAFVKAVAAQAVPTLVVGSPALNPITSDRGVLFARPLLLRDGTRRVLVGEMSLAFVESVLSQVGAVQGLAVTFERDDGELLASAPHDEARLGQRLAPLPPGTLNGAVAQAPGRLGDSAAFVVVRPSVYRSTVVAISLSHDAAFAVWRRDRQAIFAALLLFAALAVGAGATMHAQLARQARAQRDAADAKATLDRALASMDDGFLLCDPAGCVAAWNARYVAMFPWLREVIAVGVPFERIADIAARAVVPDDGDVEQRAAWRARRLSLHGSGSGIHDIELPDGRVIHTVERRTADGGVVSVFRDTTARERELARAKSAADAAEVAKAQFLASMTDEMRTPLNGVLGMNRLLLSTALDSRQSGYAKAIGASARKLLALVDDVLELAKLEAGRLELSAVDFDPRRVLDEVAAGAAPTAEAKGLTFAVQADASLPDALRGDLRRLRQVLGHLVSNAVKFTERGSVSVEMRCRPLRDGRLEMSLAVRDSGVGIAPEAMPALFERFTQVDSSAARRHGGSGVGLALSREIVDRMGGRIAAESQLGAGSAFHVTLPFEAGDADAIVEQDTTTGMLVSPGLAAAARPARVLVAEDNEVNQMLVRALLDQLGYPCDVVADGHQAVEQMRQQPYDVVLMDIRMPGMDGIEATGHIRALPGTQGRVPIIAVTANAAPEDCAVYTAAGMNDHVPKPVQPQQLADALARALPEARLPPLKAA
jgi:signal transduction histidine kinase/ActR/RegA family two-component response regulator